MRTRSWKKLINMFFCILPFTHPCPQGFLPFRYDVCHLSYQKGKGPCGRGCHPTFAFLTNAIILPFFIKSRKFWQKTWLILSSQQSPRNNFALLLGISHSPYALIFYKNSFSKNYQGSFPIILRIFWVRQTQMQWNTHLYNIFLERLLAFSWFDQSCFYIFFSLRGIFTKRIGAFFFVSIAPLPPVTTVHQSKSLTCGLISKVKKTKQILFGTKNLKTLSCKSTQHERKINIFF